MPPRGPRTILLTGATGAIGGALARAYAQAGKTLILQGRNPDQLGRISGLCRERGAEVREVQMDLTDVGVGREWMAETLTRHDPDLVILNAGVNIDVGEDGSGERWDHAHALIELNLVATMGLADLVGRHMRARGGGQLVLMSSLAGEFGIPVTPSYSASKAGLKAYGEALRGWLGPRGVRVNVVMPGYVASVMCDAMPGPKPFLMPPERAAAIIRRGLARDRARIAFPFWLSIGTRWLGLLPTDWALAILRRLGYRAP